MVNAVNPNSPPRHKDTKNLNDDLVGRQLFPQPAQRHFQGDGCRGPGRLHGQSVGGIRNGRFADGSPTAGSDFKRKAVHRGAAFGDLDNDGRIDAVVTVLNGPLEVWWNATPAQSHWLLVKTIGTKSNRDGAGAKIKVVT